MASYKQKLEEELKAADSYKPPVSIMECFLWYKFSHNHEQFCLGLIHIYYSILYTVAHYRGG